VLPIAQRHLATAAVPALVLLVTALCALLVNSLLLVLVSPVLWVPTMICWERVSANSAMRVNLATAPERNSVTAAHRVAFSPTWDRLFASTAHLLIGTALPTVHHHQTMVPTTPAAAPALVLLVTTRSALLVLSSMVLCAHRASLVSTTRLLVLPTVTSASLVVIVLVLVLPSVMCALLVNFSLTPALAPARTAQLPTTLVLHSARHHHQQTMAPAMVLSHARQARMRMAPSVLAVLLVLSVLLVVLPTVPAVSLVPTAPLLVLCSVLPALLVLISLRMVHSSA